MQLLRLRWRVDFRLLNMLYFPLLVLMGNLSLLKEWRQVRRIVSLASIWRGCHLHVSQCHTHPSRSPPLFTDSLGVPSPFFPGILLSKTSGNPRENGSGWKERWWKRMGRQPLERGLAGFFFSVFRRARCTPIAGRHGARGVARHGGSDGGGAGSAGWFPADGNRGGDLDWGGSLDLTLFPTIMEVDKGVAQKENSLPKPSCQLP